MRRFKSKKRRKKKKIITNLILIILIVIIINYVSNIKLNIENKTLIDGILRDMTSSYNLNEKTVSKIIKSSIRSMFNSPEDILKSELKYERKEISVSKNSEFLYNENDLPLVYIYNSHQGEQYSNKYLEDYNIVPNVLTASFMLEEKLENKGINTLVEESDILQYMRETNLNHAGSYIASRHFLINAINKYDSIKLYIDLHRDSVEYNATLINIGGKDFARVMFVIGLKYDTYEKNLSIVEKINNKINERYPGLSRGILKKDNIGANGIYNQDLKENIILIELGGYQNNIDEINNTLDVLSEIIGEYINETEEE